MQKNILVTGTGGRSVGAGILHALLRTSREVRDRWHVVAADTSPFAWGLYKADDAVLLPPANSQEYVDAIQRVVQRFQIDAIIPGTQVEILPLLENRQRFLPAQIVANRVELMPLMFDKFALAARLHELDLPTVETLPVEQWACLAEKRGFPLVVKPTRSSGGSRGLHLVTSGEEMQQVLSTLDQQSRPCIQAYVGSPDEEYTVGVLHSVDGNLIDSIVLRRQLSGLSLFDARYVNGTSYAVSTGYSQGYVVCHPRIQSFSEHLASRLGSIGPLNIQLRYDQKSQDIYVFEIHPRFSGSTPIRADVGFNEVDICLRNWLFDEQFGRISYQTDVAAIRAFEHVIVPTDKLVNWK